MFGFSKKNYQVNLARHKVVESNAITIRPQRIVILLLMLAAVLAVIYFLLTAPTTKVGDVSRSGLTLSTNGTAASNMNQSKATNTLDRVVEEVSKQYLLPVGETPTMALITSLDELEGQAFFAKAQVNDIVLMYMESKKGILWRPSTGQIIEIGPIMVKSATATSTADGSATSSPSSTTSAKTVTKNKSGR